MTLERNRTLLIHTISCNKCDMNSVPDVYEHSDKPLGSKGENFLLLTFQVRSPSFNSEFNILGCPCGDHEDFFWDVTSCSLQHI